MSAAANWPVAVIPVGNVACASRLWRTKGRLHVTVIVKASFELTPDQAMAPTAAEPIRPETGEAAPYLTQTDIVLTRGHAYSASSRPVAALSVRLAAVRDWPVVDKKLLVYPRSRPDAAASPVRVQRLGLGAEEGPEAGTVVNPADPSTRAGLGPLGAGSEERLATLGGQGVPRMVGRVVEIDDLFPWSYFQVAPPDQRTTHLRGDEWLVLEGMHPDRPRWTSRLPAGMAQVAVYPPGLAGGAYFVEMVGDQVFIDAQRGVASLLWRGSFPVESEAAATSMTMVAGVALPGQPVAWPSREQLLASPILRAYGLTPAPAAEDEDSLAQTLVVGEKFDVADLQAVAGQGASPQGRSKHTQLALTAEGILALTEEVIELDLEPDDELDDAQTVALTADESDALKSALGLPTARKQMLRPARLVGLPWMEAEEATHTPDEPTLSGDDDAPELEAYTIDSLELTLSESLIAQGISREELEALIALGGKIPSSSK